ncbi:MAG: RpiB/LacA/LacB family sugar-phosphate isomerase [Spirochaetales bacterium]|nr:RpiB/LacA/LacB family sugar-phosphate isomerase [Spirochaetales bacterium]
MNIVIANDHGAVELKKRIALWLTQKGHTVKNLGTDSEDRVDYPDMAKVAVKEFKLGGYDLGILLCGTGIGISIAANRHSGVRCALIHDSFTALMAKEHNNANFIALGGRVQYRERPEDLLELFMNASFQGGRHEDRIEKIDAL